MYKSIKYLKLTQPLKTMWQRIKQLFVREEELESIDFSELRQWFDEKSKQNISELNKYIEDKNSELKELIGNTKQKIEIIKNAKLPNPDISEREKHFLEGNRETYVKSTLHLINQIENNKLSPENYDQYFSNIINEIEKFVKSNLRAFQILQEFLAHESSSIGSNIRKIELLINKQKEFFEKNNYKTIVKIKERIIQAENDINRKNKLSENALIVEQEIRDLIEKRDVVYSEIKNLENNQLLQDLLKKLKDIENKIKQQEQEIIHFISQIESALKKYSKISTQNQKVSENYIAQPIQALLDDNNFIIIKIINEIKSLIENNNIEIKDSRREKILDLINELNNESLNDVKNQIIDLKKIKESASKEIDNLPEFILLHKKLEELKHLNEKIEKEQDYIEELRREMQRIKPEELINDLQNDINKIVKVKIVF